MIAMRDLWKPLAESSLFLIRCKYSLHLKTPSFKNFHYVAAGDYSAHRYCIFLHISHHFKAT